MTTLTNERLEELHGYMKACGSLVGMGSAWDELAEALLELKALRASQPSAPPISREDLEIVCEAAEGWAGEREAYSDLSRKNAATIRAAIARLREACK